MRAARGGRAPHASTRIHAAAALAHTSVQRQGWAGRRAVGAAPLSRHAQARRAAHPPPGANVILTTKGIDDTALKYFVEAGAIAARRVPKDDLR